MGKKSAEPTKDQRTCIECVDGPLLICAGAGSGKTFVLTQRIAYALEHPELSGVSDVNQVLAITFTKKAAAEIKARVRSTLRSKGMGEQAQLVDGAWIGTIHGTCERILRAHALDLGLDPGFVILDDHTRELLLDAAFNDAIRAEQYPDLFGLFDDKAGDIRGNVRDILDKVASFADGPNAIEAGPAPRPASEIARDAIEAMRAMERAAEGCAQKWADTVRERVGSDTSGIPALERFVAENGDSSAEETLDIILDKFKCKMNIRNKGEQAEAGKEAQGELEASISRLKAERSVYKVAPARDELLKLARGVWSGYAAAKRAMRALDQDDLLRCALRALREKDGAVAREYRDKFRLVMVDEFQDTNQMQVEIVRLLSDNLRRLCTVGDAQQSIYGFRGADIEVYQDHRKEMGDIGAKCARLETNFRSHGEIIEFANQVFSRAFKGYDGMFLPLEYVPVAEHEAKNPFTAGCPRVDIVSVPLPSVDVDPARCVLAEGIARRFIALHEDGSENRSWADMVILLGKMTNAQTFVDALLARGIPCVVSGGSTFTRRLEAREVCALAGAVANPYDASSATESDGWGSNDAGALGTVLVGGMFGLSLAELTHVASCASAGSKSLWGGLCAIAHGVDDLPEGVGLPTPRESLAAQTLVSAVGRIRREPLSVVLRDAILTSGWLDRLEAGGAVGVARAGNVFKALRMVEEIETDPQQGASTASIAATLRERFKEGMKEGPGALNLRGQDAVRIMTIHASKGLEFPIVALADCYDCWDSSKAKVFLATHAGRLHVAVKPTGLSVGDLEAGDLLKPGNLLRYTEGVISTFGEAELGELRRKLYVGVTRAREALIIAAAPAKAKDATGYKSEAFEDIRLALVGGDGDLATSPEGYPVEGELGARVTCERIECKKQGTGDEAKRYVLDALRDENGAPCEELVDDYCARMTREDREALGLKDGDGEASGQPERLTVPVFEDRSTREPLAVRFDPSRAGMVSYSSLADGHAGASDPDDASSAGKPDALDATEDAGSDEVGTSLTLPDVSAPAVSPKVALGDAWAVPTSFGSAFHLAAQWMAACHDAGAVDSATGLPTLPSDGRLRACLSAFDVSDPTPGQLGRLRDAVTLWAGSQVAREAYAYPRTQGEAPLCLRVGEVDGGPGVGEGRAYLEGSIDLLCFDPALPRAAQRALVVDYKTGGTADETPEALHDKHLLQAQCYALAVLEAGFSGVDLRFVRVEQRDPLAPNEPQVVPYSFGPDDLPLLRATVIARCRKKGALPVEDSES